MQIRAGTATTTNLGLLLILSVVCYVLSQLVVAYSFFIIMRSSWRAEDARCVKIRHNGADCVP